MKKQNNTKIEQIEWNFNNLCPIIYKIFYNLLHNLYALEFGSTRNMIKNLDKNQ
jgi:hypothetical protein